MKTEDILNNAINNCILKVGDSVIHPIWSGYNWKIKKFLLSKGKLRASLIAVFGQTKPKYDFWKGKLISEDKIVLSSEWVENLKSYE